MMTIRGNQMYLTEEILDKLNSSATDKKAGTPPVTLADIMVRSFAEMKTLAGDSLSWGEKNHLWQQAQTALKENRMAESRILSRANPQLANAVRLGIRQSSLRQGYDDLFPQRAGSFVKPGSVASMFSPAGYLTELYREARKLHDAGSRYHLDKRRPDLASLSLSQGNMDDELSTLSLSNDLLLNSIETAESLDYDGVMKMLSTYRQTGMTPFHLHYESARRAIMLQDEGFTAFRRNPDVTREMHTASLLGIEADISPELYALLTEETTEANADELIKKNFGENVDISVFQSIAYLARWYGLSHDKISSLLGMVSISADINPGVQYYRNDQLVTFISGEEGGLEAILVQRTEGGNVYQFGYAELIPVGGNKYLFNFSIVYAAKAGSLNVGTGGYNSKDIYSSDNFDVHNGVPISLPVTLSSEQVKNRVNIGVTRVGGGYYANMNYDVRAYPFGVFLLKLNKLIRLYKATGIAPSDIRTIIESNNCDLDITGDVLSKLFWVRYYMQRYGTDVSAALVLSGADISQINHSGEDSAFNRLFNTPLLNNAAFAADGAEFDLKPGGAADSFRSGVLKRAFQVNDTELFTLWSLAQGRASPGPFTATAGNLSVLYRVKLLADVHGLSVTELAALLSVSPYADADGGIAGISRKETDLAGLVSFLDEYTRWLKDEDWTVSDLYLMTTDRYSTALSPDIENLVTTLKDGLANQDLSQADDAGLIRAAAPFIAAATQLDSADTATALLQWLDQLKPQGLTVKDFLVKVALFNPDGDNVALVSFCQVLGQLALIVRSPGLTAGEIALAVVQSDKILPDSQTLAQDIATVRALTRFHHWLQQCGPSATEILSALGSGTLTPAQLAQAMMLDEQMVVQGLDEADKRAEKTGRFDRWTEIDITLQWMDMAATLGITPAEVRTLINVKFADDKKTTTWSDWVTLSNILQGGLSSRQTAQLQAVRDEALSSALSAFAIKNIAPTWVTDRDKLYSWLLIDNQVSAQIKTTRIAEAIASVQLYVNRALSGQEEGVDNAVKSGRFFTTDWDTYNKRYSTWAGVSELVYYPENYVDPTMRIGQTSMMDEMLQTLSQSQLNSDTVEDAFKTYMTRFEEIASLDIISGYHDSVSDQNGITYLVGRSAIGDYYWRSADINKMSDGKLPANAWTEWKKITAAITPVSNLMRPVIFGSRFHIVWVESKETAKKDGDDITKSTEYQLKYAHILHDGSWSSPVSVELTTKYLPLKSLTESSVDIISTGIYCAHDTVRDCIFVSFYEKKQTQTKENNKNITGLLIHADGAIICPDEFPEYFYSQFDTSEYTCLNTQVIQPSVTKVKSLDYKWGESEFSLIQNSPITVSSAVLADNAINFTLEPEARLVFSNLQQKTQVDALKKIASIGDVVLLGSVYKKFEDEDDEINGASFIEISAVTLKKVNSNSVEYVTYLTPLYSDPGESWENAYTAGGFKVVYNRGDVTEKTKYDKTTNSWVYTCDTAPDFISLIFFTGSYEDDSFWVGGFESSEIVEINMATMKAQIDVFCGKEKLLAVDSEGIESAKWDESLFHFPDTTITVPQSYFMNGTVDIYYEVSVLGGGVSFGSETLSCTVNLGKDAPSIKLFHTAENAQYLQYGVHRIRVNTLFAKQLVSRANAGLDTVLSMDTQRLQEPKPGEGNYVTVTFSKYDPKKHGDGSFELYLLGTEATPDNTRSKHLYTSGHVSAERETTLSLFLPWDPKKGEGEKYTVYVGVKYSNADYTTSDLKMMCFTYDPATGTYKLFRNTAPGMSGAVNNSPSEPMDFNGANALYFWEMFYYVPMMVFKRLLSEGRFTEATRWIKYIWSPDGYLQNDQPATWTWNVRPLEEETTWHANPLDSADPDAVAQADPLHYKVATFMAYLDLLFARGDAAYRQLERDTLNEAKMWYVQALNVLGNEPYQPAGSGWASPRLSDAADKTTQKNVQQALMAVRQQLTSGELRTANSLTSLFLPQQNEKLAGYWQTLNQRLYNLRHNLSIDGNPLSLAIFAAPADPAALLSAAVNAASGGVSLPPPVMPVYRFPVILESARGLVSQLTQFGSTLLSLTERQDAEALSELLQTQGAELVLQGIAQQMKTLEELDADRAALEESRSGAQSRLESYTRLYEEDVNTGERQAMDLALSASVLSATATTSYTVAAGMDAVPNIYGIAFGGSRYGSIARAVGTGIEVAASATRTAAERLSQSEMYRRRREEWEIQRNNAQSDVKQIDAQLASLAVRREAAVLQKTYLETQQGHTQAQMAFLQNKFSNKALYNWLRGRLSAIYYQFYDLTVSRCLMAQEAYRWALAAPSATFIRPGAWQGSYAGLMAGETLMLNLVQMEQEYLKKDQREKEVTRTVCLSAFYTSLPEKDFVLAGQVVALVTAGSGSAGTDVNGLKVENKQLQASLRLADLNIRADYPDSLGHSRRIKQISVTLPALTGPYQDVRAVLSYDGSVKMPRGCDALAVSHGMNDSGQFQLDFNDSRWLPFEGIPVDEDGTLTLSFPDADGRQKDLLLSLTDIILHIRYTITIAG